MVFTRLALKTERQAPLEKVKIIRVGTGGRQEREASVRAARPSSLQRIQFHAHHAGNLAYQYRLFTQHTASHSSSSSATRLISRLDHSTAANRAAAPAAAAVIKTPTGRAAAAAPVCLPPADTVMLPSLATSRAALSRVKAVPSAAQVTLWWRRQRWPPAGRKGRGRWRWPSGPSAGRRRRCPPPRRHWRRPSQSRRASGDCESARWFGWRAVGSSWAPGARVC
jgi:hypothetical protein